MSMMGYASLMDTNPVFKLGLGQVLLFVEFFVYLKFLKIDKGEKYRSSDGVGNAHFRVGALAGHRIHP